MTDSTALVEEELKELENQRSWTEGVVRELLLRVAARVARLKDEEYQESPQVLWMLESLHRRMYGKGTKVIRIRDDKFTGEEFTIEDVAREIEKRERVVAGKETSRVANARS